MSIDLSRVRAIDPPRCGCTECMTGEYIPYDSDDIDKVMEALLTGEITDIGNNTYEGTFILYRATDSAVYWQTNTTFDRRSDYVLIKAGADTRDYHDEDAPYIIVDEIEDKSEEEQAELINALLEGEAHENRSYTTYIAYRSPYGDTGLIDLWKTVDENVEPVFLFDDR